MKKIARPLNEAERYAALELGVAVHYLIRKLDALKDTTIYRHSLKMAANRLLPELERHAKDMVWDGEVEGADTSAAADQMEKLSDVLDDQIRTLLQ